MSSLFVSVLRQAFKTFDRANQATFATNFAALKTLTDQLTFGDMHLSQHELFSASSFEKTDRAPCLFLNIFENDSVSLGVFVMRSGFTMPIHDHPMMYGILRCIYGTLRVQSYTQQLGPDQTTFVYDRMARQIAVRPETPAIVTPKTESGILTPRERNFHEITALDGVGAFFDILSPPYGAVIPEYGKRDCCFYRPLEAKPAPLMHLERIPAPISYYCDTAEPPEIVSRTTFVCSMEAYSAAE